MDLPRRGVERRPPITPELGRELETEELEKIRAEIGDDDWFYSEGRPDLSRELFERVALGDDFVEFLTLPAESGSRTRPRRGQEPKIVLPGRIAAGDSGYSPKCNECTTDSLTTHGSRTAQRSRSTRPRPSAATSGSGGARHRPELIRTLRSAQTA